MINPSNVETHKESWESIWKRQNIISGAVNSGRSFYNSFFTRLFRKHVTKDSSLLELGCGTSTLTLSFAPELRELIGLDISPESVRISRELAQAKGVTNATFVLGNCLDVPYKDRFDLVWSQGLMEHFDDPVAVAREHFKAVKPGGTVLISVPYRWSYFTLWYAVTRPRFLRRLWPWTEQTFFTKKRLREIGALITPDFKAYVLQPFLLGIVILELHKR